MTTLRSCVGHLVSYDIFTVDFSGGVCLYDISRIQVCRFHILELVNQDEQAITCMNCLNETYASIATVRNSLRIEDKRIYVSFQVAAESEKLTRYLP